MLVFFCCSTPPGKSGTSSSHFWVHIVAIASCVNDDTKVSMFSESDSSSESSQWLMEEPPEEDDESSFPSPREGGPSSRDLQELDSSSLASSWGVGFLMALPTHPPVQTIPPAGCRGITGVSAGTSEMTVCSAPSVKVRTLPFCLQQLVVLVAVVARVWQLCAE